MALKRSKKISPLLVLILTLGLCCCNNHSTTVNNITALTDSELRKRELPVFLRKFKILPDKDLNLPFDGYNDTLKFNPGSSDTLFIRNCSMATPYGMLQDTSRRYILLWYAGVENGALSMTVLSKEGMILDEKMLSTGLYGWDCGYNWNGRVFINSDQTIVLRDSIITFDCDSLGPQPESMWKHELDSVTGKITPEGKIELSSVRQTKLD